MSDPTPEMLRGWAEEEAGPSWYKRKMFAAADAWKLDKLAIVGLTHDRDRLAEDVRSLRKRLEEAEAENKALQKDRIALAAGRIPSPCRTEGGMT